MKRRNRGVIFRPVGTVWLVLGPVMLAIVFPLFIMLTTALKPRSEIFSASPAWLPHHVQPANFVEVFRQIPLARYFANSLIISISATALCILLSIPAAYALARLRFRGRRPFLYALLITEMFSPIVIMIGLYKTMAAFHLLDRYASLILTYAALNLAFAIWMLTGYLGTIPEEIEEAAIIDGCTRWRSLVRILLPLSGPGLVTTIIFVFIAAWNEFMIALTFISSPDLKPLTVGIFSFVGRYDVQWNYLMAASLLATLPVVALFLVIEKHLVRGLTAGAIR